MTTRPRHHVFIEWLRAALFSVETVVALFTLAMFLLAPDYIVDLVDPLFSIDPPGVLAILAVPYLLTATTWKLAEGLLRPVTNCGALLGWPDYWRLALRVRVALLFSVAGAVSSTSGWILYRSIDRFAGASISVAGFLVPGVSLVTVALAKLVSRDILDRAM